MSGVDDTDDKDIAVLFDLIHLKDGMVLCLDNEQVNLYKNRTDFPMNAIGADGKIDLTVELDPDVDIAPSNY